MIDVVASVPHSGTRTLVKHLGIGKNSPRGAWMHFGYGMDKHHISSGRYHLHIPLRRPMDVAQSWAGRGKNIDRLIEAYDHMFDSLDQSHTIHVMEDIPPLDGTDDRDRNTITNSTAIERAASMVVTEVVNKHVDFFQQHYG